MFHCAEENRENKGELCTADFGILSKNRGHKPAYYAVRASIVNVHNNGREKDDESTNTRDEKIGFMNALANSGVSFADAEKSVFSSRIPMPAVQILPTISFMKGLISPRFTL